MKYDVIAVSSSLAGLVAMVELTNAGKDMLKL